MGVIVELQKRNEFKDFVKAHKNVLVKIGATWCGPCKRAAPYFKHYYNAIAEKVDLVVVDADEGDDICAALKVRGVPIYLFYQDALPMEIVNTSDQNEIKTFFEKVYSLL